MNKKPIIAGNWKMNKVPSETKIYTDTVLDLVGHVKSVSVIFAPPFTGLFEMSVDPPFYSAAQNCHWADSGAFTGEISINMIKDLSVSYVIVGHSERRQVFKESDDWINKKVRSIVTNNLKVILCVGETSHERKSGETEIVIKNQIEKGLKSISDISNVIIAYEPVWAIGTGDTASAEQIEATHSFIRNTIHDNYDKRNDIHILYGGSVNSTNAKELIQINGVDGFLIGGASLDANSFASIIKIVDLV